MGHALHPVGILQANRAPSHCGAVGSLASACQAQAVLLERLCIREALTSASRAARKGPAPQDARQCMTPIQVAKLRIPLLAGASTARHCQICTEVGRRAETAHT